MQKGFIIAGTNSGCGKTTITIGLMALLKSLEIKVAPFKTGPDYIDPLFHSKVLGKPSYNLDSFMLSESAIKYLYKKHSRSNDLSIVEGVMGMYDGMGHQSTGSTYELSEILGLPVVLVVSCKGLYQSVAAIVKGFCSLKQNSNVKGVILNHVPNNEYYQFIKSVIERESNVSCLGYVPTNKDISLESRHLGLIQAEEVDQLNDKVGILKDTLANTIDIAKLLDISKHKPLTEDNFKLPDLDLSGMHIGVSYDKAFRFYYKDNLELLEELGATLHYFSPLKDTSLPKGINCLYLGGGYPELFASELSENILLRKQINSKVEEGFPVYAECGGLMYLAENIIDLEGKRYPMCGIYNASVQMTQRLQRFGYATAEYNNAETRCHEFHRSEIIEHDNINYTLTYHLSKPQKQKHWQCGLSYKNCLAAYAHVHFYAGFNFFENIIDLWKRATI